MQLELRAGKQRNRAFSGHAVLVQAASKESKELELAR